MFSIYGAISCAKIPCLTCTEDLPLVLNVGWADSETYSENEHVLIHCKRLEHYRTVEKQLTAGSFGVIDRSKSWKTLAGNDTSRGVNACLFINATRPLNFSRISLFDLPPNDLTVQAIAFNSALSSSHQTELCHTRLKGTANGTNHGLTIRSLWRNTTEKIAEAM